MFQQKQEENKSTRRQSGQSRRRRATRSTTIRMRRRNNQLQILSENSRSQQFNKSTLISCQLELTNNLKQTTTTRTTIMCRPICPSTNQAMFLNKSTSPDVPREDTTRPHRNTMMLKSSSLVSLFWCSSLMLLLLLASQSATLGYGAKLPDIYWNSSNPM